MRRTSPTSLIQVAQGLRECSRNADSSSRLPTFQVRDCGFYSAARRSPCRAFSARIAVLSVGCAGDKNGLSQKLLRQRFPSVDTTEMVLTTRTLAVRAVFLHPCPLSARGTSGIPQSILYSSTLTSLTTIPTNIAQITS
jgi:hypothetical protein